MSVVVMMLATVVSSSAHIPTAATSGPAGPHRIRLPEDFGRKGDRIIPATGRLLIATDRVRGSIFEDSVILLIDYSETSATGVIINRPTDIPVHSIFPNIGALKGTFDRIYLGGPVEPGRIIMLVKTHSPTADETRIVDDVYVSSSTDTLARIGTDPAPDERVRLYTGYAGWGPHQLDTEILRGSWILAEASAEIIFDTPAEKIRERLRGPRTMEVLNTRTRSGSRAEGGR